MPDLTQSRWGRDLLANEMTINARIVDDALEQADSLIGAKRQGGRVPDLVDNIACSEAVYRKTIEEIDSRLKAAAYTSPEKYLSELPKYIKALLLIARLEDDQEIIVYFGDRFHATLSNVDAYSGLLYAYEYFEHAGMV